MTTAKAIPKKITWEEKYSSCTTENEYPRLDDGGSEAVEGSGNISSGRLGRRFNSPENRPAFIALSALNGFRAGRGPNTPSSSKLPLPEDAVEQPAEVNEMIAREEPPNSPLSVEGTLLFRKCHTSDNLKSWRRGYVVFDMRNGGSISCYKEKPHEKKGRTHFIHSAGLASTKEQKTRFSYKVTEADGLEPRIHLPSHVNWVAKDIQNYSSGFIIEIPSAEPLLSSNGLASSSFPEEEKYLNKRENQKGTSMVSIRSTESFPFSSMDSLGEFPERLLSDGLRESEDLKLLHTDLKCDIERAKTRGQSFRIYFRCSSGSNEKLLWFRAFEQMERLSNDFYHQRGLRTILGSKTLQISTSRTRTQMACLFADEGQLFDSSMRTGGNDVSLAKHGEELDGSSLHHQTMRMGSNAKEYRVYPKYAYPNRWMTESELYSEMIKPSDTFHDLRRLDAPHKEIGILRVELLQCLGLPALDFASETDAVAYMVCGSYAFTSDVISNKLNPIWLPRSRRACIFPLFHPYARLYLGIFDDDGKGEKDDFAGRVILDLAQCRPRSTYDVTLPLRLSRDVYSKRRRGSVRLRFHIEYHSERDALLSYIPRKIRPQTSERPDDDVTVICADEKAFRNIATTVHGLHMPGRFSFLEWKSVMREANFARKCATNVVIDLMLGIVKWENPALSLLIFCAWMHCIYMNTFSLVPAYLLSFLFLMMVRSYAFYGSDGPIQNGFIPPSFEEMFMALIEGGTTPRIAPLKITTPRPQPLKRGLIVHSPKDYQTHRQRGNWIFRLLGFKKDLGPNQDPRHYQMEFAYSQGLQNPLTKEPQYPKFTVAESLVSKKMIGKNKKKDVLEDDGENMFEADGLDPSFRSEKSTRRSTFDFLISRSSSKDPQASTVEKRKSFVASTASPRRKDDSQNTGKQDNYKISGDLMADLPPRLRLPEQNADAKGPARTKKLEDELAELRDNLHKLTFHLFNDRVYRVREGTCYFGTAQRGRTGYTDQELERLLNVGQYCSVNFVVARVGLYMEPMISAAYSGLSLLRAIYNIITWRDPFLSFWVTLFLLAGAFVLSIFPWRLFLFVTGFLVVGPQNYVLRVMQERGTTPNFIHDWIERRQEKMKAAKDAKTKKKNIPKVVPTNQPIVSCHTSDSTAPPALSFHDVDPREVHEVCVPYSQLMYHRMYDWPPEPGYATSYPTADLERPLSARSRTTSRDSILSGSSRHNLPNDSTSRRIETFQ